MRPAAGPLMARWLPLNGVATIPPMIAEITPAIGGTPDAAATPNPSGNATSETLIAARKSDLKFEAIPFHPFSGSLCILI